MSCNDQCNSFYADPSSGTLGTRIGPEDCGQCIYQFHTTIGGPCSQCCIDNYPYLDDLCNSWCPLARCLQANPNRCTQMQGTMFGTTQQRGGASIGDFVNRACSACQTKGVAGPCGSKETYCAGCAEGGYYNYYQLGNAYAPHIFRR